VAALPQIPDARYGAGDHGRKTLLTQYRGDAAPQRRPYSSAKRERRRAEIIDAAAEAINVEGLQGLVLAEVAARVGMTKANLTYYFARKEDLAAACVDQTLRAYRALVAQASSEASPRDRLRALYQLFFARAARQAAGQEPTLVVLTSLQALGESRGAQALDQYAALLRETAALLGGPDAPAIGRGRSRGRAQLALTHLFWAVVWSRQIDPGDYRRCAERLFDLVADGLGAVAIPDAQAVDAVIQEALREDPLAERWAFYQAATRVINQAGYRGASVDRIGAAVKATKGAVYHHHASKDEVMRACSDRSFALMWAVMRTAHAEGEPAGERLAAVVCALSAFQTSAHGPFLRAIVLGALPAHLGDAFVLQWRRVTQHLAGLVSDAIAERGARPIDPFLAAQVIAAGVNAADELQGLAPDLSAQEAAMFSARATLLGLFSPEV